MTKFRPNTHTHLCLRPCQVNPVKYGGHLKQWARRGFPELGDTHGVGLGATTTHVMKHPQFDTEGLDLHALILAF